VLQLAAVCCSVLQCVLQCVWQCSAVWCCTHEFTLRVLQCVVVCCRVSQSVAVWLGVCCSVVQCVAACVSIYSTPRNRTSKLQRHFPAKLTGPLGVYTHREIGDQRVVLSMSVCVCVCVGICMCDYACMSACVCECVLGTMRM